MEKITALKIIEKGNMSYQKIKPKCRESFLKGFREGFNIGKRANFVIKERK